MRVLRDRRLGIAALRLGALARVLHSRRRFPPGSLAGFWNKIKPDQRFYLKKSCKLGPVFKVLGYNAAVYTCIVGHGKARDLFLSNEESLRGMAPDVSSLFPHGFLHFKHYFATLIAIQSTG